MTAKSAAVELSDLDATGVGGDARALRIGDVDWAAGTFTKDAGSGKIRLKSSILLKTYGQDLGDLDIGG